MDPDHPLAALVLKARQERNGTAPVVPKPEEAAPSAPAQYTADREYIRFCLLILLNRCVDDNGHRKMSLFNFCLFFL